MAKSKIFLLLLSGSVLTGLTLIFPAIGVLQWFSLIPTVYCLMKIGGDKKIRLRKLYGYGFFSFYIFYLFPFHFFLYMYPLEFTGITKPAALAVVLVAHLGLSAIQAFFGGFVFVLYGLLARGRLAAKFTALRPVAVGGLWAVYEWTQTLGWFGVPWARLPLAQTQNTVWLQSASLFGSYFVTFIFVAFNAYIAYAFLVPDKRKAASAAAVFIMLANTLTGSVLLAFGGDKGEEITVAAVQGNISSVEKWEADSLSKTMNVYEKYTRKAAEQGADIVVWPESAIPLTISPTNPLAVKISEIAKEAGVSILVGTLTAKDGDNFNSIMYFRADGSVSDTVYNKRRLVPFGEFVPMNGLIETLIPPLAELVLSGADATPGTDPAVTEIEGGRYGSLICFDSIYEQLSVDSVRAGAELLCVSTNDSWFADSAALYMHNSQSQLRAIETGRYVVRAANTGVTTVFDPKGKAVAGLEPHTDGQVTVKVRLISEKTLYTVIGNLFVYLFAAAFSGIFVCEIFLAARAKFRHK